jgi:hypothetical protein
MDLDFLYSCVIDSTWFFLATWLMVLLGAYVAAFRRDSITVAGAGAMRQVATGTQSNPNVRVNLSH